MKFMYLNYAFVYYVLNFKVRADDENVSRYEVYTLKCGEASVKYI